MDRAVQAVLDAHRAAGRMVRVGALDMFVREMGTGPAVLCLHGVPASSFLYRKVLDELASLGLGGIAVDLPGAGFTDRPAEFDYSWTGLGRFAVQAVEALGLERFHLVVHDIGGPVGFEMAAELPERIASLTLLNTIVDVATFAKPWVMRPFEMPVLGELWLAAMRPPLFDMLMGMIGVADIRAVPRAELAAWPLLVRHGDNGRAFLKTMRGFEPTPEKQALYRRVLADLACPKQVVWGARDPALRLDRHGEAARRAAGVEAIQKLPAKHFVQEDQAPAVARAVGALARARVGD